MCAIFRLPLCRLQVSTDSTEMVITKANRINKGKYVVTAENDQGTATDSVDVKVLGMLRYFVPPCSNDIPSFLCIDFPSICSPPWSYEDSTKEAVTLKWKEPKDDGGSEIINYTLQMRESNKKVLMMSNLMTYYWCYLDF